ncbi:MAG: hypothetical protein ACFCVH_07545 [Alphaproteobacteria bacterium]
MVDPDFGAADFLAAHAGAKVCFWYAGGGGDPRDVPKGRFDLTLREALDVVRNSSDLYFYDIDLRIDGTDIRLGRARIESLLAAASPTRQEG